ncbi:MAG: hypothetical protein AAGU78_06420 [Chloroflexota bacterium]
MKKWTVVFSLVMAAAIGLGAAASAQAQGPRGLDGRSAYPHLWSELIDAVGDATGLTDAVVRQQVRDGETLAAICAASDCDLDAVRAEVSAEVESALAYAVENERLTQEQADEWLAELPDAIDAALESTTPLRDLLGGAMLDARSAAELVQTLSLMADLSRGDLRDALDQDLTLADLAEQAGLDEAAVVEQALAHLENQLQVFVDNERITQEQMDEALADAAESYPELMQQPLSELQGGFGGRVGALRHPMADHWGGHRGRMGHR